MLLAFIILLVINKFNIKKFLPYLIVGIFSAFLFLIFLKELIKKIKFKNIDNIILFFIIFINLFVFYFMPTKILIINPFIIISYIIIFKHLDKKKIYFLIIFNFAQWFIFYDIADKGIRF